MISAVALLVADYDEGIAFFVGKLGFDLLEDTQLTPEKRWVRVAPKAGGTALLLAKAVGSQIARIGDQTGGRVSFFLNVDDFDAHYAAMIAKGVRFVREPVTETYGKVAVFEDCSGNLWDLLGP